MLVQCWVEHGIEKVYLDILQDIVDETKNATDVIGLMVIGSVARGDALPGADLNLRVLLMQPRAISVEIATRQTIRVEKQFFDIPLAQSFLERDPKEVYAYLDGHILLDPLGAFTTLTMMAQRRFKHYVLPEQERIVLVTQLKTTHQKLATALKVGDFQKAAYLSCVNVPAILTGLWIANDKPMPPQGTLWSHVRDLSKGPFQIEQHLHELFTGDIYRRATLAMSLIDWSLNHIAL